MRQHVELDAYSVEAEVEATHWWFVGRRHLLSLVVKKQALSPDATVLDIGISSGGNLTVLREQGLTEVIGLDVAWEALRFCRQRGWRPVGQGDLCQLPFREGCFDFVLAMDVLEHVEDDVQALHEIRRVLRPGGRVLITVPAFSGLWGVQDVVAHHKRRYRLPHLLKNVLDAGLSPVTNYYFNFILFLPIWFARRLISWLNIEVSNENNINSPFLNRLLKGIFAFDVSTAGSLRPPFGVSALILAEKIDG